MEHNILQQRLEHAEGISLVVWIIEESSLNAKVNIEFHRVLCWDQFYLYYTWFLLGILFEGIAYVFVALQMILNFVYWWSRITHTNLVCVNRKKCLKDIKSWMTSNLQLQIQINLKLLYLALKEKWSLTRYLLWMALPWSTITLWGLLETLCPSNNILKNI